MTMEQNMDQDRIETLIKLAVRLRDELHGLSELFFENDPASRKLIAEFDEFLGGVELVNAARSTSGTDKECG